MRLAEWHKAREAQMDADEDAKTAPKPLGPNPTRREIADHDFAVAMRQKRQIARDERAEKRDVAAESLAAFRASQADELAKRAADASAAQAAREAARVAAWENDLRARYLSQPGATAASWDADKAAVLQAARRQALQAGATEKDLNRARFARQYE